MTPKDRRAIERAIKNQEMVTVHYAKPNVKGKATGGAVTRHVKPYELSVNRRGRAVVWGTDSIHGPQQIHAFRTDRIMAVKESKRPQEFDHSRAVAKHLTTFDNVGTGRGPAKRLTGPGHDIIVTVNPSKTRIR